MENTNHKKFEIRITDVTTGEEKYVGFSDCIFLSLKCVVCGRKSSKPAIFMSGRRYCSTCARFALNFAHDLAKEFRLPDSDKGGK